MIDYSKKPELNKKNVIYKITNLINSKIYVGQTKQKLSKRWKAHRKDARDLALNKNSHKRKSVYLARALNKHEVKNFKIEIIEECSMELLNEREVFWIKELNSLAPNGYNLTTGGDSPVFSQESLKKMSIERKGKKLNVDYNELRKNNSRKMRFTKDNQIYEPEIPADFMREHNLDSSSCHKVALNRPKKTYGRNGKCYLTTPTHCKGWKVEYI